MAANVHVNMDEGAIQRFIAAPDGPVMRWLIVTGNLVKRTAIATYSAHEPDGWPRAFLGPTTVVRVVASPTGPRVRVGTDHTQTEPHIITGNPLLFFVPTKGIYAGKLISKHQVNHPGSNFDDYASKILNEALFAVRGAL